MNEIFKAKLIRYSRIGMDNNRTTNTTTNNITTNTNSIEMQIDNFLEQFKRSASKAMEVDWSSNNSTSSTNSTNHQHYHHQKSSSSSSNMTSSSSSPSNTTANCINNAPPLSSSSQEQHNQYHQQQEHQQSSSISLLRSKSISSCFDIFELTSSLSSSPPPLPTQSHSDTRTHTMVNNEPQITSPNATDKTIKTFSTITNKMSSSLNLHENVESQQNQPEQHQQSSHNHIFQHQSSVASTTSIQTVLNQQEQHQQQQQQQQQQQNVDHNSESEVVSIGGGSSDLQTLVINNNSQTSSVSVELGGSSINYLLNSESENCSTSSKLNHHNNYQNQNNYQYKQNLQNLPQQQQQQHYQYKQMITSSTSNFNSSNPINFSNSNNLNVVGATTILTTTDHETLCIGDVADLLHPQYAILTGGRSHEGCSIITFPDHMNFHSLNEHDYTKLMIYLTSVPSLQEADLGFNIIIDRRKDRWNSVKAVLLKISDYFPGIIHIVYVVRPSGFFQKAISEVSTKFFKEEFKFRFIICATLNDLHEHIDKSQLTSDLGGDLMYSHHEWIQQRISLEKFSGLTHQISLHLDMFMRAIHDTEFPNSVEATQMLLDDQGANYDKLKEEILSAAKQGEQLLGDFRAKDEISKEFSERTGNVSSTERAGNSYQNIHDDDDLDDSRDYRRLLVQLEETERRFDDFWNTHLTRLKQCLDLRLFEQDFRELQMNFDEHLKIVSEMTEIGASVSRIDTLIDETNSFRSIIALEINRAEDVVATGQQLISVRGACPADVVQPKCNELSRVCEIITERLVKRLDILSKTRDLMERVEKANMWCTRGVELLASQRIEKCSVSVELAEQSLQEIQEFLASAIEFRVSSPREFRNVFEESATPETTALVSQVLQRIDDVSLMCDKRVTSLKKLTLKPPRPVQQVIPEPAVPIQPPGGAPHLNLIRLRRSSQSRRMDAIDSRPRSMEGPIDSGISINGDNISSPDSDTSSQHIQNQIDSESRRLKRGHVLAELLETERIYVAEMGSILKGYRDQLLSDEMVSLVPPGLQGKDEILFGNLHELYTFHSETFLKDLENCVSTTELVALCFVQRRDTFYRLYSYYCQNIPRSERLRETLVDTHLFLQECQKRLGHKLPLAAYLLKPVQRITKYQLLLRDLLRFSDNGTCARELQKALDCMLIVLKCVNDSMHQIAITGFSADLTQQGELLLQDSFQVWTESKKDLRLRMKTQQRHIFLYQKAMLFCKQASKTGNNKSTYQFKHYLKMSQIGLTESVRGDNRRFEVWLQGRQEVHTIQAVTVEIKNKWVAEIKKVLLNQLEELKGEKIKQYGLNNRRTLRQTVSWDHPMTTTSIPQRTVSYDASGGGGAGNCRTSNRDDAGCSSGEVTKRYSADVDDMIGHHNNTVGSSEHENPETGAWSSDYSNSEDEFTHHEDGVTPGNRFISLADYIAMGHSEVSLREGDKVELLKVGCAGWWYVSILGVNVEGWAPAAYLEPISNNRKQPNDGRH